MKQYSFCKINEDNKNLLGKILQQKNDLKLQEWLQSQIDIKNKKIVCKIDGKTVGYIDLCYYPIDEEPEGKGLIHMLICKANVKQFI